MAGEARNYRESVRVVLGSAPSAARNYREDVRVVLRLPTEPANTAYTTAVKADSPLGYYRLEDGVGSVRAYDSSGNARHGTCTGGEDIFSAVDGGRGVKYALQAGQGIDCGASNIMGTGLANMSLEAWVKSTATGAQKVILAARDNSGATGSNNYAIYLTSTKLYVGFYCASGFAEPNTPLAYNDGLWHHIVGVYNGATVKIYVDGAEVSSTVLVGGNVNSGGSARLKIASTGGGTVAAGTAFDGSVDEVAIYGTALSATQVSNHYAARLATATYVQVSKESLRVAIKSVGAARVSRVSLRAAIAASVVTADLGLLTQRQSGVTGALTVTPQVALGVFTGRQSGMTGALTVAPAVNLGLAVGATASATGAITANVSGDVAATFVALSGMTGALTAEFSSESGWNVGWA